MIKTVFTSLAFAYLAAACSAPEAASSPDKLRVVSADLCADQYALALLDRDDIAALSPDARKSFSYYRNEADGLPIVRPRTESILALRPDVVLRSYGGEPNLTGALANAGIRTVQIPYARDLGTARAALIETANALGAVDRGAAIAADVDVRVKALGSRRDSARTVLYITSKGAIAGRASMIDELISIAGHDNFEMRPGWRFAPLEALAYRAPDIVATSFFDGPDANTDRWSASRHPVAQRMFDKAERIDLPGAWTACNAWFALDAAEALAEAGAS
ncbi:MAG: ABC transporter substrate-binding protein [Pseudomonadota bacterium]